VDTDLLPRGCYSIIRYRKNILYIFITVYNLNVLVIFRS